MMIDKIDLQILDCNCSDCYHFKRSMFRRQKSVDLHYKWQKDYFDNKRLRIINRAQYWIDKGEKAKAKLLLKEARNMVFQFDESECALHYGDCGKLNKQVSCIPEILQLDTQECFEHRRIIKP